MRRLLIKVLAVALAGMAISILSCPAPPHANTVYIIDSPRDPFSTTVDWYNRPPKNSVPADSPEIARELIHSVLADKRGEAVRLLGGASAIAIDVARARELAGL